MLKLIRPELRYYQAYKRSLRNSGIWLNANELPIDNFDTDFYELNRYPVENAAYINKKLAALYKVDPTQILLTRGSDEGIDILIRLFCCPYQDEVMICPPTFSMYANSTLLQSAKLIEVPLKEDFSLDREAIESAITKKTKLIFLCSPNNPTGNLIPINEILKLLENVKEKAMIVVDEAYIEFSQSQSMVDFINQYENLVVLRTFSKAYGLAGLRCGVIISQALLIEKCRSVMPPYPFSTVVLNTLCKLLTQNYFLTKHVPDIINQREWMKNELVQLKEVIKICDSSANFLLVKFSNAKKILKKCIANNIYIKSFFDDAFLSKYLRISMGLATENKQLINVLKCE